MFFLAKYNTQTIFYFAMVKRGVVDLAASADWTPATGDTKISKDGGNFANTTNNPVAVGGTGSVGWSLTLTATELQAGTIIIQIVDSATKAVEDQYITIYTYGNASAKIIEDFSVTSENQVWDALRSNHTVAGSVGLLPRGIASDGTATAGAAGSVTLAATEPTVADIYKGAVIAIFAGTGAGQARMITTYSTGRVASVVPNWITAPDNTSKYIIHGFADPVLVGQDNKVILSTDAHTGATVPTVTSVTNGVSLTAGAVQAIWDALTSALTTANSVGKRIADFLTGDAYVRLGAPTGASVSADVAAVDNFVDTEIGDIQSRLPAALVGGRMDSSVGAVAASAITDAGIATDMDAYQAKVWVVKEGTTADHYAVVFFKNGQPVTSGITSPAIQVIKASDGTDLITSTALTEIGSLGIYKKDENTNKMVGGAIYFAKVTATIDGSSRTWLQQIGRDSS